MRLSSLLAATGLELLPGSEHPDDPSIEWVHTTELLDPSMYLTGGELILTTGLWRRRRGDAKRFISTLKQAGVTAIGYGLPAPDTTVPSDIQEACTKHNLCLVQVPYETPFIAISKAYVDWLTESRQKRLVDALRRTDAMTDTLRRGRGPEGILRLLHRDTELDGAVLTRTGEVFARSQRAVPTKPVPDLLAELRGIDAFPAELTSEGEPITVFAVRATGSEDGYLVIPAADGISDEQRAAIDQAIAFLAVEFARRRAVRATELRFSGELLDLIRALPARLPELCERLVVLGVDPEDPSAFVAISAEHDEEEEPSLLALEQASRDLGLRSVVLARGREHLLLMDASDGDPAEVARHALTLLESNRLVRRGAAGVGSIVPSAADLRISLSEARQACALAGQGTEEYSIALAEQAGSHDLMLALADLEVRTALTERLIEPLRAYDLRRGAELVRTLTVFLGNACQWQPTANTLNVHVNTLRHRLARINTLTGRDLSQMEARVDFYLALRAAGMES